MPTTAAAAALLTIARSIGATDYDVTSGSATTSKLARLRLPNGRPMVVQIDVKTPRIWMLPEHEAGGLSPLGRREHYETGRGRHHHLDQVREFAGRSLVKVEVENPDWRAIREGLERVGAMRVAA